MQRTIVSFLAAVTVSMLLSAQDSEGPPARRYDIRALQAAMTEKTWDFPFTLPPTRPGGAGEASVKALWGIENEDSNPASAIENVTNFVLRSDSASVDHGWLRVSGGPPAQEQVGRVLAELQRALLHTIEVELSILPSESISTVSSAVLDQAKTDRLLAIAKPLATMRTRLSPGSEKLFEAVARRAYVKDYDTEAGPETRAYDPLIDVLVEGQRVCVRVDRTADGAYVVTARGQTAEPNGPARMQVLNFKTPGTLHLPREWWSSTSASARLGDRSGLLIGNDVTPRAAWLVRVLGDRDTPPAEGGTLRVLPISAATRRPLQTSSPLFFSPNPSGAGAGAGGTSEPSSEQADDPRLQAEVLLEAVQSIRFDGLADDQRRVTRAAGVLALQGDPRFVAEADKVVSKMIDEATRTYTIEIRLGTISKDFVLPASEELATLVDALPQRALTAAIAGDRVVVVAGESHAYLKDRDIEIGNGVTIDDPIVDVLFTGLSMSCRILPAEEGQYSGEAQFEYQELLELMPASTGSIEVPETELPRIASAHGIVPVGSTLGSWTLVHAGPLEGTERQLVILMRVNKS